MKTDVEEKLIVRESFAMFYGGGEIFFIQLDGLHQHKALVMEKFARDMEALAKPSAPSQTAVHLKDTMLDKEMALSILRQMNSPGQHQKKVAVVGLNLRGRRLFQRLLRDMDPPARFVCEFFADYEQAKMWLVQ